MLIVPVKRCLLRGKRLRKSEYAMTAEELDAICRNAGAVVSALLTPQDINVDILREHYSNWSASGNTGALDYIDNRLESLCDPFGVRPWAKAALVIGFPEVSLNDSPLFSLPKPVKGHAVGSISSYALHEDYHLTGRKILEKIAQSLGEHRVELFVDAGPVPEKDMAIIGGLGTPSPNSLVRIIGYGCSAHIGVMFTDAKLPAYRAFVQKAVVSCSECLACRKVCPNHAMKPDGTLIVRRCRSWIAGQCKGALTWEQQKALNGSLFGCSSCSRCCPDDTQPDDDLLVDAYAVATMPTNQLKRLIASTPLNHSGVAIFKRNAAAAVAVQASSPEERNLLCHDLLEKNSSAIVIDTINNALALKSKK